LRARLLKLGTKIDCRGHSSSETKCAGVRLEAGSRIVMKYAIELIRLQMRVEPVKSYVGDDFGRCWAIYDCTDRDSEGVKSLCPLHR
jgi:hypothetical protein